MIPLTAIGAMRSSHSNHSERKSTALIVIIFIMSAVQSAPRLLKWRASRSMRASSIGLTELGSGEG